MKKCPHCFNRMEIKTLPVVFVNDKPGYQWKCYKCGHCEPALPQHFDEVNKSQKLEIITKPLDKDCGEPLTDYEIKEALRVIASALIRLDFGKTIVDVNKVRLIGDGCFEHFQRLVASDDLPDKSSPE